MTTKRDKYLYWKHDLLERCGQCMGFRAKGIDLNNTELDHSCEPGKDCHLTCPALGMGGKVNEKIQQETLEDGDAQVNKQKAGKVSYIVQTCFNCGTSEDKGTLLPCRYQGKSLWVCTKCLPQLIHG